MIPTDKPTEAMIEAGVKAANDAAGAETMSAAVYAIYTAMRSSAPQEPVVDEDAPFGIGDEVAVIPDCDEWASDWHDLRLWIAAIHALPGGGFDYWVCDTWPLPDKPALTDGFYMGVADEPDTLSLVARTNRLQAKAPETGEE